MALINGYAAKLYYGTEATDVSWFEVDIVKDVTVSQEMSQVDATSRLNGGFKGYLAVLGDLKFEFQINADYDAPTVDLIYFLQTLYDSRIPAYFAALDDEMGVGDGLVIYGQVMSFNHTQSLDGVNVIDVVVMPTAMANQDDVYFENTWWSLSAFA